MIAGLPVVVSDQVDAETVFWGIPKAHTVLMMRKGTKVERFPNVQKDGIWLTGLRDARPRRDTAGMVWSGLQDGVTQTGTSE